MRFHARKVNNRSYTHNNVNPQEKFYFTEVRAGFSKTTRKIRKLPVCEVGIWRIKYNKNCGFQRGLIENNLVGSN